MSPRKACTSNSSDAELAAATEAEAGLALEVARNGNRPLWGRFPAGTATAAAATAGGLVRRRLVVVAATLVLLFLLAAFDFCFGTLLLLLPLPSPSSCFRLLERYSEEQERRRPSADVVEAEATPATGAATGAVVLDSLRDDLDVTWWWWEGACVCVCQVINVALQSMVVGAFANLAAICWWLLLPLLACFPSQHALTPSHRLHYTLVTIHLLVRHILETARSHHACV